MKVKTAVIVLLGGLLGMGSLGAAAETAKKETKHISKLMRENGFKHATASWTVLTTQTDENNKVTKSESKMWLSGDKYRMEAQDQKGKQMIYLDDGKEVYLCNPAEKKAFRWGPSVESMFGSIMSGDLVAESARQRKTAKKLGSETVEGKPCDIFAYRSTVTVMSNPVTSDVKEWCWSQEKFPIKSQIKTPKHTMKIVFMTTEVPASESVNLVKDLELDKSLDESLFTLPADLKVETLELPGGAAGGPF
jgi:outer membrane lipoprotein-sorting protein